MSEPTRQSFKLHMPGLLKVLAEHLYTNKQVAIRELIQNAHDSCVRRSVEGASSQWQPRIEVAVDRARRTLTIRDNGMGLTADEINDYLSTIGRSYTRELRENLSLLSRDEATSLIGQFGFGFLSAFLLASEVTLITCSAQEGMGALRWHSSGDEYYELSPAPSAEIGTTVELHLKPSALFVLQQHALSELILKYADFIPTPIYLLGDPLPLNIMAPPWDSADPQQAALNYIERAFNISDPMAIIHLGDHTVELEDDSVAIPLKGFLFVPPGSMVSLHEFGELRVYIRRMFITDKDRDLLPPWARFVRGVIDCPFLQPTASREGIYQDENFALIRQALEKQLNAGLRQIATADPARWKQIVLTHMDLIMGWAVKDNQFFEQIAEIVALHTSRGMLTLAEYLSLTSGAIYYVKEEIGSLQDRLLAESSDVPVIDAHWFSVTEFLAKYVQTHPEISIVQLDGDAQRLMRPVSDALFDGLLAYYRARGARVRLVAFRPPDVPALMLYPANAEFIANTQRTLDSDEIPAPLAGLISTYVEGVLARQNDLGGTFYVNAACPLMRQLAQLPAESAARNAALGLVYQIARLFAGRTLGASDVLQAFQETTKAIGELAK